MSSKNEEGAKSKRGVKKGRRAFCFCCWHFVERERPKFKLLHTNGDQFGDIFLAPFASPEKLCINPNVDLCRLSLILQEQEGGASSERCLLPIKIITITKTPAELHLYIVTLL